MKKMFRSIVPHIIPEFKLFLFRILPLALILALIFYTSEARYLVRNEGKLILYSILLSIAGIYLVRITAYVILRVLTQIPYIIPDIFHDESKNQ